MRRMFLAVFVSCLVAACEKTLHIEPAGYAPKLVVEAQIESGQPPFVALSGSLNYFSEIDSATLVNSYVHGAKLTLSDGSKTVQLVEVSRQSGNIPVFYYTTNPAVPAANITGVNGKTYTLTIETGGEVYNTVTSIPLLAKQIDTLWWKKAPNNPDSANVVLMGRITDPPGLGNYIRYFTRANSEAFQPGSNSVYDDQVIDGKTYEVQIDKGVSRNDGTQQRDDFGYFKKGDTVTVKHCNIDKASYDFWRTWEFSYRSIGNPFSSPGKVIGNISNGALGSFCGYAVQYKVLIIPK